MQKTQEQFSANAKDGVYAENAGAVFCECQGRRVCRKRRSSFLRMPWTSRLLLALQQGLQEATRM